MKEKKPTIILRSTYELLKNKKENIEKKLVNEVPTIIREAYETGGRKNDNASWEDALREQEKLIRELLSLIDILYNVTFIEDIYPFLDEDKITIGKTIEVKNLTTEEILELSIVGPLDVTYHPSNKKNNFVSYEAPFIQPLLGKSVGERVTINLPNNTINLTILEIKPLTIWELR